MAKNGKVAKLKSLLLAGPHTVEELHKASGCKVPTIRTYLTSLLKKQGFTVKKEDKAGVLAYSATQKIAAAKKTEKPAKTKKIRAVKEESGV